MFSLSQSNITQILNNPFMPIDFNTIRYYYSCYLSSFRETVVQLIIAFPIWQKKRSDITVVPIKQQVFKLVLVFGMSFPVIYLLFVKSFTIVIAATAVMLWACGISILSRHTVSSSFNNNLKQPYLSSYKPLTLNHYEQISYYYRH